MTKDNTPSEYNWCFEEINMLNVDINYLAEIGSRDGLDAIKLTKEFNPVETYIFEADPRLSKKIQKNIDKVKKNGNFKLFNIALGSKDKNIKFFAVDEEKYSNEGVGSLYKINFDNREVSDPDYKIGYIQKEINVEQKKYVSLQLKTPDLIAMDVESAELEVLKGFENQLENVKVIVLETSIHEYHFGGSTFIDVHNYLKSKFKLVKNTRYGVNNYKLFQDHYKYKFSIQKKFQNAFDLMYVNRSIL